MQAVTITQITASELEILIENSLKRILSTHLHAAQPEVDQLLTIQQAAEILFLSVPTIYGLVSHSEIPCMKKGKRLYFSKYELTDWIKTGRKNTIAQNNSEVDNYLSNKK